MIENDYKIIGFHSQALLRHLHCSVCAHPKQCQYTFNVQGPGTGGRSPKVGGGAGQGGGETGRKGGGRCTGGMRRGGGKRKRKGKLSNIAQNFAIAKMQRGGSQQIQGGNRD